MLLRSSLAAALAASLLCAAAAPAVADPTAPTTLNVQLSEYRYDPAEIDLAVGQPVVLHLTNAGTKTHNLVAKAFFKTVTLDPASADKVRNGGIEVDKGASVDVAFTPNTAGEYDAACTHPLHAMLGMKGRIVVK